MGSENHPGVLRGDTTELGPDMQLNDTKDHACIQCVFSSENHVGLTSMKCQNKPCTESVKSFY